MVAAAMGRLDMVSLLLGGGADPALCEEQGLTAVHLACLGRQPGANYVAVLDALLRHAGGGRDLSGRATAFEDAPLHLCASMCAEAGGEGQAVMMARLLLLYGADPSPRNAAGNTPADIAREVGAQNLVRELEDAIARGAGERTQAVPGGGTAGGDTGAEAVERLGSDHVRAGQCVAGSLQEGYLHLLNKKRKEWDKVYYAIVPMLQDHKGSGHGDFAYFLRSYHCREGSAGVIHSEVIHGSAGEMAALEASE